MAEPLILQISAEDLASAILDKVRANVQGLAPAATQAATGVNTLTSATQKSAESAARLGQTVTQTSTQASAGARSLADLSQSTGKAHSSFLDSTKSALGFAAALTGVQLGVTAVGSIVRSATAEVLSFQSGMANVSTLLVGPTSGAINTLREQILTLPPAFGSSTELAKGLYAALSGGVEASKSVAFVGQAAQTAKAGLTSLGAAVETLVTIQHAFQLQTKDTTRISDILFQTVNVGKGSFEQFSRAFADVSPLAKTLGISLDEVGATLGTLSFAFPTAVQGGTALNSLMNNLIQHTGDFAAQGINLKQVIGEVGLTGFLKLLNAQLQGSDIALQKLIPDQEAYRAGLALNGPFLERQTSNLKDMGVAAGSTSEAFKKQTATAAAAIDNLVGSLERATQKAAPPFLAITTGIANTLAGVVTVSTLAAEGAFDRLKIAGNSLRTSMEQATGAMIGLSAEQVATAKSAETVAASHKTATELARERVAAEQLLAEKTQLSTTAATRLVSAQENLAAVLANGNATVQEREQAEARLAVAAKASADATVARGQAEEDATKKTKAAAAAISELERFADQQIIAQERLKNAVKDGAGALQNAYAGLGEKTGKELKNLADGALINFQKILADGKEPPERLRVLWNAALEKIRGYYTTLPGHMKDVNAQVAALPLPVAPLIERLTTAFETFGDETIFATKKTADEMLKQFTFIKAGGLANTDQLLKYWQQTADAILKAYGKLPEGFQGIHRELLDRATTDLAQLPALFTKLGVQSKEQLRELAVDGGKELGALVASTGQATTQALEAVRDANGKIIGLQNKATTDFSTQVKATVTATTADIIKQFHETVNRINKGELTRIPEDLQANLDKAAPIVRKATGEIVEISRDAFGNVRAEIVKTGEATQRFGGHTRDLAEVFSRTGQEAEAYAKNLRIAQERVQGARVATEEAEEATNRFGNALVGAKSATNAYGNATVDATEETNRFGNALAGLSIETAKLNALQISQKESFGSDVPTLLAQLDRARKELSQVNSQGEPPGSIGFKAFTSKALNESIDAIKAKLKTLNVDIASIEANPFDTLTESGRAAALALADLNEAAGQAGVFDAAANHADKFSQSAKDAATFAKQLQEAIEGRSGSGSSVSERFTDLDEPRLSTADRQRQQQALQAESLDAERRFADERRALVADEAQRTAAVAADILTVERELSATQKALQAESIASGRSFADQKKALEADRLASARSFADKLKALDIDAAAFAKQKATLEKESLESARGYANEKRLLDDESIAAARDFASDLTKLATEQKAFTQTSARDKLKLDADSLEAARDFVDQKRQLDEDSIEAARDFTSQLADVASQQTALAQDSARAKLKIEADTLQAARSFADQKKALDKDSLASARDFAKTLQDLEQDQEDLTESSARAKRDLDEASLDSSRDFADRKRDLAEDSIRAARGFADDLKALDKTDPGFAKEKQRLDAESLASARRFADQKRDLDEDAIRAAREFTDQIKDQAQEQKRAAEDLADATQRAEAASLAAAQKFADEKRALDEAAVESARKFADEQRVLAETQKRDAADLAQTKLKLETDSQESARRFVDEKRALDEAAIASARDFADQGTQLALEQKQTAETFAQDKLALDAASLESTRKYADEKRALDEASVEAARDFTDKQHALVVFQQQEAQAVALAKVQLQEESQAAARAFADKKIALDEASLESARTFADKLQALAVDHTALVARNYDTRLADARDYAADLAAIDQGILESKRRFQNELQALANIKTSSGGGSSSSPISQASRTPSSASSGVNNATSGSTSATSVSSNATSVSLSAGSVPGTHATFSSVGVRPNAVGGSSGGGSSPGAGLRMTGILTDQLPPGAASLVPGRGILDPNRATITDPSRPSPPLFSPLPTPPPRPVPLVIPQNPVRPLTNQGGTGGNSLTTGGSGGNLLVPGATVVGGSPGTLAPNLVSTLRGGNAPTIIVNAPVTVNTVIPDRMTKQVIANGLLPAITEAMRRGGV